MIVRSEIHIPTMKEIDSARTAFQEREPSDLFYRVATELIDLSIRKATTLSVGEALAVLLQTWNKSFYRFHPFSEQHLQEIENHVKSHWDQIAAHRRRCIESFVPKDEPGIISLFTNFEQIVGRVGTAKCLHLLAPRFFPLWDNKIITKGYGIILRQGPRNAKPYLHFMEYAKQQ